MYKFYPQFKKVVELIKNDEIGDIISMRSSYGTNLITKKKFFFLKKKRKLIQRMNSLTKI